MSNIDNGGPAFPSANDVLIGDLCTGGHSGMTLRDYFAAKAICGLLSSDTKCDIKDFAFYSYAMADAMLEARKA